MDISALLKAVIFDIKARDHETVLSELSSRLLPEDRLAKMFCSIKGLESTEGVLSGTGSAVFHCLSEDIEDTAVAVAVSKKGIRGRRGRKIPDRIFFLIVSPIKESGSHLQILSKVEGLLLDRSFNHAILNARNGEDVAREIRKAEGAARSLYIPLQKDEVFRELDTSGKGLTISEAQRRLKLTGPNTLKRIEKSPLLKDFLGNMFLNLFALLLWAGGMMSFVAGMPELGWAIFLVIVINALFSFWQEYRAERAVEALKRLLPKKVRVIRDGEEKEIDADTLVPGDLIRLSEGDSVPADGRLVDAQEMRVDNSSLTGESKPVYKVSEPVTNGKGFIWTEVPNLVFAGTTIVSGTGTIVVTATGMDTEIGRVAFLTQAIKPEMSPLQKEIESMTRTVTLIAVTLGLVFFLLGYHLAGLTFAESFIFAIGIIVANVPEGLLPTVSLSLAMGVQRMAGKNAIVKKLSAVETLGSATVICTDKTGTLTSNRMNVVKLFINGRVIDVNGTGYAPEGGFVLDGKTMTEKELEEEGVQKLLAASALCNNAALRPPSAVGGEWTISGDPTEGALLTAAAKAGIDLEELKAGFARSAHLPFERMRKRMSTVHALSARTGNESLFGATQKGRSMAFIKGAPTEVLRLSSSIYANGGTVELEPGKKEEVLRQNDLMAAGGLRVLAVACREVESKKSYKTEEVEAELTFIGLVAMLDPPRPEVKQAIADCGTAGIKVVMVTGDYGLTARAIGGQVGLVAERVVTGEELNRITHSGLRDLLKKGTVIFARVEPKDKLRVVHALQENGEVVAVTGDGVNDSPALRKADIGVAMGLRGSDVAKESADIILADDNFASIVDAVREGRAVYANIKKFVTYIFASNIPEIIPFIAFVIFKVPLPLTVLQILAVDLGTDVLPALGLGVEPPEKGIMNQPPRPRGKKLLDFKTLSRAYLFLGPMEALLCLSGFFFAYWLRGWAPGETMTETGVIYAAATTMTFAGIVASQIGNVFACRTDRVSVFTVGFLKNRFILLSLLAEIAITLTLVYIPPLARVFGFSPLGLKDWAFLLIFPFVIFGADELRKLFIRKNSSRAAGKST